MYLKKLTEKKAITMDYNENGTLKKLKGRVYCLNVGDQSLSLVDEKQELIAIKLSGIMNIY